MGFYKNFGHIKTLFIALAKKLRFAGKRGGGGDSNRISSRCSHATVDWKDLHCWDLMKRIFHTLS